MIAPPYCLERGRERCEVMVQEWGTQVEPGRPPELRKCCWEWEQGIKNSQGRVPEKRKLYRKRAPEICRRSPLSLWLSTNKHLHVRKLTKFREGTIGKNQRGQYSEFMQGQEQFLFLPAGVGNLIIHRKLGRDSGRFCLSSRETISSRQNTTPNKA